MDLKEKARQLQANISERIERKRYENAQVHLQSSTERRAKTELLKNIYQKELMREQEKQERQQLQNEIRAERIRARREIRGTDRKERIAKTKKLVGVVFSSIKKYAKSSKARQSVPRKQSGLSLFGGSKPAFSVGLGGGLSGGSGKKRRNLLHI